MMTLEVNCSFEDGKSARINYEGSEAVAIRMLEGVIERIKKEAIK